MKNKNNELAQPKTLANLHMTDNDLCDIKEKTRKIKFEIMSMLGLKLNPFSKEDLELFDKVKAGIANAEEKKKANETYILQRLDSEILSSKVESYIHQCKDSHNSRKLMIH